MSSIDGASIKSASIDGCDSSESGPRAKRPRRGPAPRIFGPLQLFLFIQTPGGWYQQLPASDNVDSSRASGLVAVGIGSWELVKTSGVAERLSPSLSTLADFVVRRTDVESRALLVYKVQSLVTLDEPEAVGAGTLGEQLTRSLNKCVSFVDSAHGNVFLEGHPSLSAALGHWAALHGDTTTSQMHRFDCSSGLTAKIAEGWDYVHAVAIGPRIRSRKWLLDSSPSMRACRRLLASRSLWAILVQIKVQLFSWRGPSAQRTRLGSSWSGSMPQSRCASLETRPLQRLLGPAS